MTEEYIKELRNQYIELCNGEKEIEDYLKNSNKVENGYKKFCLLSKSWVQDYKKFLINSLKGKIKDKYSFDFNSMFPDREKNDFEYISESLYFTFACNFSLVPVKFIRLILKNFKEEDIKYLLLRIYSIIIGSQTIIRKDNSKENIRYITIYDENQNYKTDFILIINNEEKMKEYINIILNNNFWYFLEKLNISYLDEFHELKDDENKIMGYLIRNCDLNRCKEFDKMKNKRILNLEKKLNEVKSIIKVQKSTIIELQNKLDNEKSINNNNNNTIKSLQNAINQKDEELNNLKAELLKKNNVLSSISSKQTKIDREEMMCINFISYDYKIHFAVPCTGSDVFAEIEEKLYKKYPEYRETNNIFLFEGLQVLRFKTVKENNLGSGFPITLFVPQD